MDEKKKGLTYAEAGVDIDAGEREVELIKKSVQATYTRGVLGDLGGFGGLFRLKDELSEDPILVSGTDGVGTKLRLAIEMGIHHTIGQDCVLMMFSYRGRARFSFWIISRRGNWIRN